MLRVENALRLCSATQTAFASANSEDAWMDIVDTLTFEPTARAFGLTEPHEMAVAIIRMKTAAADHPDCPELRTVSLWRKYNRAAPVKFSEHDPAPPCLVQDLHGTVVPLFDPASVRPLVVFSSSIT